MEKDFLVRFDFAIKNMLRDKKNFDILEGFIEVFLNKKCKIVDIIESESNQEDSEDKFNRVDIKARDTKGEIFIVEVQTTRFTYYLERILYGVSKAVIEQIDAGYQYGEIKQVYSISVVYYDLGVGDDYFYECKSDFYGVHTHDKLQLSRREELTVEEIKNGDRRKFKYEKMSASDIFPKYYLIRIKAYKKFISDAMGEWMEFLKNNSIKADTTVPGLSEARRKLTYANMTPEEKYRYNRHMESLANEKEAIDEAEIRGIEQGFDKGEKKGRAEGRAEGEKIGIEKGRAEGEKQKAFEIAKSMKSDGFPIENIIKYSGLTAAEIESL
jgi:predicted transposase/invertase (TIGR01784 family)